MSKKVTKSIIVLCMILTSTFFTLNLSPVNAVDKTTNYSSIYYVTEQKGDAYYLSGYEFRNNSTLGYLKSNTYDTYSGFRFTGVTLLGTAIIDHAYLCLYSSNGVDNYDYMVSIYGEDVNSGNDFDTSTDLTGATLTSSHSNWNMKDLEGNSWRNSTDIKTSIQEIIDRVGWASGNNLSLILLGAISANGYRSFRTWDYDGGHTYRARLYVQYHISTPVSNSNPWDYISDFNSGWNLLNGTNGYTWWEVWNGTTICAVKQGYMTWYIDTDDLLGSISGYSLTPYYCMDMGDHLQSYGTNLYTLGGFVNNATRWIFRSTDGGDNWGTWINTLAGNSNTALEVGSDGIAYVVYQTTGYPPFFEMFNITTKSAINGHGVGYITGEGADILKGFKISPDGLHLYVLLINASSEIRVYEKTHAATSWTVHYVATVAYINYSYYANSAWYDAANNGVDWYIIKEANYLGNIATGYYIDHDYSISAGEEITDGTHLVNSYQIESNFNVAGEIGIVWIAKAGLGIDNHIIYRHRTATKFGTLGSIYTTLTLGIDVAIAGSSNWADDWTVAYTYSVYDPTHVYIVNIDNSGNLTPITSFYTGTNMDALPVVGVVVGGESEHKFILIDPDGNPVDSIPEFPPTPSLLNTTIDNWLFKGEVYTLNATVQNANEAEFNLTDGYHTMIFYYNNLTTPITHKIYTLGADGTLINEDVIGGIKTSHTISANITYLSWKFILGINVLDIFNTTITYKLVSWNTTNLISVSISGVTNSTVNIYNLGGNAEYQFAGDGSHIVGGHPFELEATNSSLVVGGSYAESWLIYRRLQYIHLLAELDMDNEVESVEHFEPLVNIGYAEYGIDYKLEGNESDAWIEGWKCRIYAQEINVGTYGMGNDMAYVKMYVFWYNRGDFVGGSEFYSFHQGYDITPHFPTDRRSFSFWVDLWFDKTNSSTVFGGRVNAEYYGYYEDGAVYWFNSKFRPMIGNVTSSMFLGDIKDADGNIVQSKKISLVRVTAKVAKTAPGMDGLGDDNTYRLRPYDVLEVNLATDRMEGIDIPPIMDTAYLDLGGYGIWGFLINAIGSLGDGFFNLTKLFLSSADTILGWFGLPYGTFSNIISFLSILPTMLFSLLNVVSQMFANVISVIVSGSSLFIMTIGGWVLVMMATINMISTFIGLFISIFSGGLGTGIDIWNYYNVPMWLSLILLLLPLMWFQRLAKSDHPIETLSNDIDLIKSFSITVISFFDWLYDKVLSIAQMFIVLIRG